MRNFEIKKHEFIEVPQNDEDYKREGIVGFQLITITFDYFGSQQESTYDTKILKDGRQFVINGDGFIDDGFEIK